MLYSRRTTLALAGAICLTGCANSFVLNATPITQPLELRKVLIVLQEGAFIGTRGPNVASIGGSRQMSELLPRLRTRLPAVFEREGIVARAIFGQELSAARLEAGEKLLVLTPSHAAYNANVGQILAFRVELTEPSTGRSLWRAEVHAKSWAGAPLDDRIADQIGSQLVTALTRRG